MNKGKWFLKCLVAGLLFVLLLGLATMFLWNWLIPSIFNGPEIQFLQALGLLLLSKILFSSWGGGRRWRSGGGPAWKHRYYQKLSSMSAEDRERFKTRMREKWCSPGPREEKANPAG
jgi:hypothetical protein